MIKTLNEEEFKEVISKDTPALICFGALWCSKCTLAKSKFGDYSRALGDKAVIYNVDADECPNIFKEYNVEAMPKFLLFKKGELLGVRSAIATTAGIVDFVESLTKEK